MTAATRSADGTARSAVVLAVGVALGGWFVGDGFLRGRTASRCVEVKGLPRDQGPGVNEGGQLQKFLRVV